MASLCTAGYICMSPIIGGRMSRKEGGGGGMNASYIVYGIIGFMYIFVLGFLGYFMSTRYWIV